MGDCADDITSGNQRGGEDDHLEMAFEDVAANPLVGSEAYNDDLVDLSFDEHQEFTYEDEMDYEEE